MSTKRIKITLIEQMLGTACANPDVHREFIASKSADAAKVEEELAALPAEDLQNRAKTVFPRDENGRPFLFDYQIKGFIKEAVGILCELPDTPQVQVGKTKLTKFTHKRIVDNYVFVAPRKIVLCDTVGPDCVRPLRAETMKGERVSLATSETVPEGTSFECEITTLGGGETFDAVIELALNYGVNKGLGCWRNSGKGRFVWEPIEKK